MAPVWIGNHIGSHVALVVLITPSQSHCYPRQQNDVHTTYFSEMRQRRQTYPRGNQGFVHASGSCD